MALPQLVQLGVSISPVELSRAEVFPSVAPLVINQFVGVSDANTIQVASIGDPLGTLLVQLQQLTIIDKANIENFLADPLVNYGEFPFTFIDSVGVSHTVRYLEPQLVIPEDTENNVTADFVFTKV